MKGVRVAAKPNLSAAISHFRASAVSHRFQLQGYVRCMNRTATPTSTRISTPWGPATLLEQLRLPQQAGDKRFASVVELLENDRGERLVRFAYSTDGTTRRGPVTLRERDLVRLRKELVKKPALADALGEAFDFEGVA
jgi:hypothetical protein